MADADHILDERVLIGFLLFSHLTLIQHFTAPVGR
jgi:hypothetical protein